MTVTMNKAKGKGQDGENKGKCKGLGHGLSKDQVAKMKDFKSTMLDEDAKNSNKDKKDKHKKGKDKNKNKDKDKDKDKDKTNSLLFQNIPYKRISVYDELEKRLKCKLPNPAELENEHSISILIDICETNDIPLQINSDLSVPKILDTMIGHLIEPLCIEPTFLCDHPIIMSPLAKNHRTKPGLTERFELFINGSELCNAYSELNDPTEQR